MADVFISYSRADRPRIERLAEALESEGLEVWWDHQIAGGAAFAAEIERALNSAKAVIVAWSVAGVQSEWVIDEATAAKQNGKIIPIGLDATGAPLGFRQFQVIDFSGWQGDRGDACMLALHQSIDRLARRGPAGASRGGIDDITARAPGNAVAVLPLENFCGDPGQQFFVDGMHEALIADLSKIQALKVISRTSTRVYAGSSKSLREIGAELGVSRIIEGSVIRDGDEVRITVQLIDVRTDTHMWAESFDRDVTNILKLQREVARAIAEEISVILTPAEEARLAGGPRVRPEAYEQYLKGMYEWYRLTPKSLEAALGHFDHALSIDSGFAPAHAGIATAWAGIQQMGGAPTAVAGPRIKSSVDRALDLDPDLAQAHFTLATYSTWAAWDWTRAESAFRRAIELNPGFPDAHAFYAHFLSIVGRTDESETEILRALDLDPFNPLVRALYTACLAFWERDDEALEEAARVLGSAPDHWLALQVIRLIQFKRGMYEDAIDATRSLYTTLANPDVVDALDRGRARGGHAEAFADAARALEDQARSRFVLPTQIAILHGMAGHMDETVHWLQRAFEARDPDLPYLRCYRRFPAEVMDDPRTLQLIEDFRYPPT